jgi:hypothetical protein
VAFLPQALEWVRAILFGPRVPGRHRRTTTPCGVGPATSLQPSPDVWGVRLVTARSHRRKRQTSPPQAPWEPTDVLVRPYVACLGADIYATAHEGLSVVEQWW